MARTHAPITSFGAELHSALRQGSEKELRIKFPSKQLATRFKQRVHQLRSAMKAARHPEWEQLYRAALYEDPQDDCVVIIGPKDAEFRAALTDAGLTDIKAPAPVSEHTLPEPVPGTVDAFFLDLQAETNVQKALDENTDGASPPDSGPGLDKL